MEENIIQKKRMISGIKPTGKLTLGNYIGAVNQFISYQDEYEMFVFIADLHALTLPIEAKELRQNTKDLISIYLACGLDPKKVVLFKQSDVHEHAELGYIMTFNSNMGELSRMTQYKDKTAKISDRQSIPTGIFIYPGLMAADILLYDADYVPVGIDQKQHVELTRDLALRFNSRYSETFKVPEPVIAKSGSKIFSLSDPTKKMSKSESDKGTIYLLEDVNVARKKIMSATTDSGHEVKYDPENKPGISNLLTIMSTLSNTSIETLEKQFEGSGYGDFKKAVADVVVDFLTNLQAKVKEIQASGILEQVLTEGAEHASYVARKKLAKVYRKVGLR
ncbi:MAG: tryptophan--tRNA ligase [Acholeplasmatales bacterium]|nr:tryptophan--tRNA ligase [Acholeplasmatales bacterium]